MKKFSIMIKPASSLCNMRCRYCFYADESKQRQIESYGIMKESTRRNMLEKIRMDLEEGDAVTFAFQGGEPTLAGLSYFRDFIKLVNRWPKSIHVSYALQTNGLLLDEEWCQFLSQNHFLVGISFDLLPDVHNSARTDTCGKGTYSKVLDTISLLEEYRVEYNILCTLTKAVAQQPQKVWKTILKHNFQYVQFTPCLNELDGREDNPDALSTELFSSFYIQLFNCWYKDFQKNAYRSIKLFDDLVNYRAYGIPTACGLNGKCQPQLIVEADGSVYPCDFYCLDEYCLGNFSELTLKELWKRSFQSPSKQRKIERFCMECPFHPFCGGGCKRMQKEVYCEEEQCGMQTFLRFCWKEIEQIADIQIGSP